MINITAKNFDKEITNSSIPVLTILTMDGCGTCEAFLSAIKEIEEDYLDVCNFAKIDYHKHEDFYSKFYTVDRFPTIAINIKDNSPIYLNNKYHPRVLEDELNAFLEENNIFLKVSDKPRIENSGYEFISANPEATDYTPTRTIREKKFPKKVDLRDLMLGVENQRSIPSSTANAIAGAYEYLINQHLPGADDPVYTSSMFIYYNARWRASNQDQKTGSCIQYGMESLISLGACREETWSYERNVACVKPNDLAYEGAEYFRDLNIKKVPTNLDMWKQCLAEGYPIVFGCVLFDSFDDCQKQGGVVSMPNPSELEDADHHLHAMLCVGYSDVDQLFIVRNAWGERWGDQGYCYMPYNYLMSETLNLGDSWMVCSSNPLPNPRQGWVNDKKSIVDKKFRFDFNAFPATAYDSGNFQFLDTDVNYDYSSDKPDDFVASKEIEPTYYYIEDYYGYAEYDPEKDEEYEIYYYADEEEDEEDGGDDEEDN